MAGVPHQQLKVAFMFPRRFPPELTRMVINENFDDTGALQACSLISKSCLPLARRHLFSCIILGDPGRDDIASQAYYYRFLDLMANPHIKTCVRELLIDDHSMEVNTPESPQPSWIQDEATLPETLRALAYPGHLFPWTSNQL